MQKTYFTLAHLPKALQSKFKKGSPFSYQIGQIFTFNNITYQYIGSNNNGQIVASKQ